MTTICSIDKCGRPGVHKFDSPTGDNTIPDFDDPDGEWIEEEPFEIDGNTFPVMRWTGRTTPFEYYECNHHFDNDI